MHQELDPLERPLEEDFKAYVTWAQDLGYLSPPVADEATLTETLFCWLEDKRARLRAMELLFVPAAGVALDDQGALILALLELEREFSVNGFLTAHEDPATFEIFVHDLDDLLGSEPQFALRTFEVLQADLDTLLAAIAGGEDVSMAALENAFLRLTAVAAQWLDWHPLFVETPAVLLPA